MALQEPKKYIYGNMNTEISKSNYSGKTTDSLEIIVDNEEGTISGNVIWKDVLGEDENSAYPGLQGKINEQRIEEVYQQLCDESDRLTVIEVQLSNDLHKESLARESEDDRLHKKISEVISSIKKASVDLKELVDSERERAVKSELSLSNKIDSESTDRQAKDRQIETLIDNEVSRATKEEKSIRESIKDTIDLVGETSSQLHSELKAQVAKLRLSDMDIKEQLETEISNRETSDKAIRDFTLSVQESVEDVSTLLHTYVDEFNKSVQELSDRDDSLDDKIGTLSKELVARIANEVLRATAEEQELKNADVELSERLDLISEYLESKIKDLIVDVQEADNRLTSSIEREATTRENEILSITEELRSEETRSKAFDTLISSRVDDEVKSFDAKVVSINERIDEVARDVEDNNASATDTFNKLHNDLSLTNQSLSALTDEVHNDIVPNLNAEISSLQGEDESLRVLVGEEKERALKAENLLSQTISNIDQTLSGRISKTVERLEAEISRSTDADSTLSEAHNSFKVSVESDIDSLNEVVTKYINSNDQKVLSLDEKDAELSTNISELKSVDITLQEQLTENTNAISELSDSTDTLKVLVGNNSEAISVESTHRSDEDTKLCSMIETEVSRATTRENQIEDKLDDAVSQLTAKDNELEVKVAELTQKDFSLMGSISSEVSRATASEKTLDDKISKMEVYLDETLSKEVQSLQSSIASERERAISVEATKSDIGHKHSMSDVTDYSPPDLSPYALKSDIPDVSEFISGIPDEYVTEQELEAKNYLTTHQDISGKSDVGHKHSLSDVTDYVPTDLSPYAKTVDIPTKVSQLDNDKNYITEHQSISHLETKEDAQSKLASANAYTDKQIELLLGNGVEDAYNSFKEIQDLLKADDVATDALIQNVNKNTSDIQALTDSLENYYTKNEIDNKGYAKLTDIPDVSNFISEIPDEYVTDEELSTVSDSLTKHTDDEIKKLSNKLKDETDALAQEIDVLKSVTFIIGGTAPIEE